jgi:hypothetical protein
MAYKHLKITITCLFYPFFLGKQRGGLANLAFKFHFRADSKASSVSTEKKEMEQGDFEKHSDPRKWKQI